MLQGNLVAITAQQVLVMFLLILAGYLAVRAKALTIRITAARAEPALRLIAAYR